MPDPAFVGRVNHALQQAGFLLQAGDARRVAAALGADTDPAAPLDPTRLAAVAYACGLRRQGVRRRPDSSPTSELPPPDRVPHDAVAAAADAVAHALTPDTVFDPFLADLVAALVEGPAFRVAVDRTPWDTSTYAEAIRRPYDLSAYDTVGDALEDALTGVTRPTFVSGAGLAAETWGDRADDWAAATIAYACRTALDALWPAWQARLGWDPARAASTRTAWEDAVTAALAERGRDDLWLRERLNALPWPAVLARHRPDALPRWQADQARRRAADARRDRWRAWCPTLPSLPGADPADIAVAAVCAALTDGADAVAWMTDLPRMATAWPLARRVRRIAQTRLRRWFDALDPARLDTPTPLARLWRHLTTQWLADGRSWYVTALAADAAQPLTFAADNWEWALAWALDASPWSGVCFLRRFERMRDAATGLPLKTVCALTVTADHFEPVPADTVRRASQTDPATGRPWPPEAGVRYADARDVLGPDLAGLA